MAQETEHSKGQHRAAHRQRILQLMEVVIVKESKRERDGREGQTVRQCDRIVEKRDSHDEVTGEA